MEAAILSCHLDTLHMTVFVIGGFNGQLRRGPGSLHMYSMDYGEGDSVVSMGDFGLW